MISLPSIFEAIGNHIWQSTAFALLIWLMTLALRRNTARVRHVLWVVASLKFLVPFSLFVWAGSFLVRHQPLLMPSHYALYSVAETLSTPLHVPEFPRGSFTSAESRLGASRTYLLLAAAIWLGGSTSLMLAWFLRWRRIRNRLRLAVPIQQGRELEALERFVGKLPMLRSRELLEPSVFGVIRPVLIWPDGLSERLEHDHLSAIVLHELMHARRRDNLIAAMHMIVVITFWFHPLVWWMERQMLAARENACDEGVVQILGKPETYAESLLMACRFCTGSSFSCLSGMTGSNLNDRIVAIMTNHSQKLAVPRKIMLALVGLGTLLCPLVWGMVRTVPLYGQVLFSSAPLPSFEVATVKLMPDGAPPTPPPQGGRSVHLFFTAKMLIMYAYNLPDFSEQQILKGAGWMDDTYEIQGKISDTDYAVMQKMSAAEKQTQIQLMLQSLLRDRFKVKAHLEKKQQTIYALEIDKAGEKLAQSQDALPKRFGVTHNGQSYELKANGVDLDSLAQLLGRQPEIGGRSVVNKTGLTGNYSVTLRWTRTSPEPSAGDSPPSADENAPSYFTAIQQQLGLGLVATRGQVDYVVVDQIEKPSPN